MENMTKEEFMRQSNAAVERMREMNMRSNHPMERRFKHPPLQMEKPKAEQVKETLQEEKKDVKTVQMKAGLPSLNLPFLDIIKKDSDTAVIIGILLLLLSDNSDKVLLFALLYILM